MDITPIFRPPTPPKAGFFFLGLLFFTSIAIAKSPTRAENTQAQFLLFYQPLFEMNQKEAQSYITLVRNHFAVHAQDSVEPLLIDKEGAKKCTKRKLQTCEPALYFSHLCIPKAKKPSQHCKAKSKRIPTSHFKEPVFNRMGWNKFALKVNYFCNKNSAKVCSGLASLHDTFMKKYQVLMAERKNKKTEFKKPFGKKMRKNQ